MPGVKVKFSPGHEQRHPAGSRAMRIELIENLAHFHAVREEWNELLGQSAADCPFLTWEWLYSWWKHLAEGRQLHVVAVRDDNDLIGLAPFALNHQWASYVSPFSTLGFIGAGDACSGYLDVIGRRGREQDVADVIGDYLARRGLIVDLTEVRSGSSLSLAVAARLGARNWTGAAVPAAVCPIIPLAGYSWESYLATLGSEHRYNVRRKLRRLAAGFDVRFDRSATDDERQGALEKLVNLHQNRWQARGGSAFCRPAFLAFHEEFSKRALERGWLRLFVLRLDAQPASVFYGFSYKRRFYFYQGGFDPKYSKYSIGHVTQALAIKSAIEEEAEEYDFLHGAEQYKLHWAKNVRELDRLELYPPGLRGWMCRRTVEAGRVARRLARRILHPMGARAVMSVRQGWAPSPAQAFLE